METTLTFIRTRESGTLRGVPLIFMTTKQKSEGLTFGAKAIRFQENLTLPENLPDGIMPINPYASDEVKKTVETFFNRFFDDANDRIFVLGINPGRFGSGVTGIPFTDSTALRKHCGIESALADRKELTSQFIYTCIEEWGGAEKFYRHFFLTAVSPVGFIRGGVNFNYYDSPEFFELVRPYIIRTLRKQFEFGARRTAIILGTGKNQKIFTELNNKFSFFDNVLTLEHPRFVMQYRRKQLKEYVKKYNDAFAQALASS